MVKGYDENKIFWHKVDVFDGTPGMVRAMMKVTEMPGVMAVAVLLL